LKRFHVMSESLNLRRGLILESKVDVGSVHRLVATGAPAGAALPVPTETAMTTATVAVGRQTQIFPGVGIEVAFQAQRLIALIEHLLINRAVRAVTGAAAFADGSVREDEGPRLLLVALLAGFGFAAELSAAAFSGVTAVRVVAISAANLAGEYRMGVGQAELGFLVEMALEAGVGRFARIDDEAFAATGFHVLATGAVATFAAHINGVFALSLEFGMVGRAEVADEFFMAGGAFLRTHEGGPRDAWRGKHGARGRARNENHCQRGTGADTPQQMAWCVEAPSADSR